MVTDSADQELRELFDDIIVADPSRGDPLFQKLWLDRYVPYDETLFVDSDSLLTGDIDHIWSACGDRHVAYVGEQQTAGTWYGADIAAVCKARGLPWLATLNSGILYIRRGTVASRVFATARRAMDHYHRLGFEPFRKSRTDEVGFALAFSEHDIEPMDDPNGLTMRTPIGIEGPMHIDVLRGYCHFVKRGIPVQPTIVHFATWQYHPVYYRERAKLRLSNMRGVMRLLARPGAGFIYWRERVLEWLRSR